MSTIYVVKYSNVVVVPVIKETPKSYMVDLKKEQVVSGERVFLTERDALTHLLEVVRFNQRASQARADAAAIQAAQLETMLKEIRNA